MRHLGPSSLYSLPMRRRLAAPLAALALAAAGPVLAAGARPAAAATSTGTTAQSPAPAAPPQAKAWILVDADTGAVIQSYQDHVPLRPASVEKIMTGLLAVAVLPPDATVPVGLDAAGEEAAKINMKVGQTWTLQDTLHSLLMVSANDAAVALADRVSGSPAGFARLAEAVAHRLGALDSPMLGDPSGLDDSFSYGGGDFISAWDEAVITRAAMSEPAFRSIVDLPIYNFVGPDGVHHVLHNHNKLLQMDPTLIGVKPGYTSQAGDTYVAEAARGGRDMLVVELGVTPATMYAGAEYLMDQGFATPVDAEPAADHLPAVRIPDVAAVEADLQKGASLTTAGAVASSAASVRHVATRQVPGRPSASHVATPSSGSGAGELFRVLLVFMAALLVWVLVRRMAARPVDGRVAPTATPTVRQTRPAARTRGAAARRPAPSSRSGGPSPWEAAGQAWDESVPARLVDWEEWGVLGTSEQGPVSPPGTGARRR